MVFKTDKISVKEMILISLDQKTDTVTKIARKVNTGVSNCSKVVSLMKSEGLIKAEYFGNDGKSKILILTKKGLKKRKEIVSSNKVPKCFIELEGGKDNERIKNKRTI